MSFKPIVSFVRDVSNKKTTKTKANKDTKSKKSSFVIDMDGDVGSGSNNVGGNDDSGNNNGDSNDGDDGDDSNSCNNTELFDF